MSKDVRFHHPGAHTCPQPSMRWMFDEYVSTYHSAKSSLTHGLVQRGRPNIFGGKGRILPLSIDTGPPPGPSGSMGPRDIWHCTRDHFCSRHTCRVNQQGRLRLWERRYCCWSNRLLLWLDCTWKSQCHLRWVQVRPLRVAGLPNRQCRLLGAQTPNLLPDLLVGWDDSDGHLHLLDCHAEI